MFGIETYKTMLPNQTVVSAFSRNNNLGTDEYHPKLYEMNIIAFDIKRIKKETKKENANENSKR